MDESWTVEHLKELCAVPCTMGQMATMSMLVRTYLPIKNAVSGECQLSFNA